MGIRSALFIGRKAISCFIEELAPSVFLFKFI